MTAWRSVIAWNILLLAGSASVFFIDWGDWIHFHAPNAERVSVWVRNPDLWRGAILPRDRRTVFVPGVGELNEPGAEVRWGMHDEFFVTQRANRWGFLDREPLPPQQAARTCHIAFIGDSFVEASEVPVADKFHVRLEELAARSMPHLNITTSAFGRRATGQINQLPFYDKYARRLRPKLVVLVFVPNDIMDNHPLGAAIYDNWDPDLAPYVFAEKTAGGAMALRPLAPGGWRLFSPPAVNPFSDQALRQRIELLAKDKRYQSVLAPYLSEKSEGANLRPLLLDPTLPLFREAVEFTAYALDEFRRRVDADGGQLWLLLAATARYRAGGVLRLLQAASPRHRAKAALSVIMADLAKARAIPVLSQQAYIVRQGRKPGDGIFPRDGHWNSTGHLWAAETLLERLRELSPSEGPCKGT